MTPSFSDNYYQILGSDVFTLTPNGRNLNKDERIADINIPLGDSESSIPPRAGFIQGVGNKAGQAGLTVPGIGGPHSRVWRWYAGTIDLSLTQFEAGTSGEPLFRSLADGSLDFPFGSLDVPYYVAHEYVGAPPFQYSSADAVWEGIGEGWAFSSSGGAVFQGTTITTGKNPQTDDNADEMVKSIVNPFGVAVETVFNGTFEHGNIHRGERFPSNEIETPGWSLHGGAFQSDEGALSTFTVHEDATGNYVAELNSWSNTQITHNRFYIPQTAQSLEFSARVKSKESSRTGRLTASISLDGKNFQPIGFFDLTATSSQYSTHTFSLNNTSLGNMAGKMGYIRFELTHPSGGTQAGIDRVYLDNVRLLGVGLALQTESAAVPTSIAPIPIAQADLTSLIETARAAWQGLIVEAPNGVAGVTFGQVGVTAPDLSLEKVAGAWTGDAEQYGNTGSGESGVYNQLLFKHSNIFMGPTSCHQQSTDDEFGINRNASFPADGHAVEANPYAVLVAKNASFLEGVVDEGGADEATVIEHGAAIYESAIDVANLDIGANLSAPGGEGAASELEILKLEKLLPFSFMELPTVLGHGDQFVAPPPLFNAATGLGESENQNNQNVFQHSFSFGSHTLPSDRKSEWS